MREKIEKQKKEAIAVRERCDNATAQLKQSMDRLETIKKDEIIKAFSKSSRTYDEVMVFLRSDSQEDQNEE